MRKGARSIKSILPDVLEQINSGQTETISLVEILACDIHCLLLSQGINSEKHPDDMGIVDRMRYYSAYLPSWSIFATHKSDIIRGLAAFNLVNSDISLEDKLENILHFADDSNAGVREWAWLSIRPYLVADLECSIEYLTKISLNLSPNIRRFCSEVLRPRGVWCSHIDILKRSPELYYTILNNLKNDSSKYVQNSVGNWLNDAGKTRSDWVKNICDEWGKDADKNCMYIIKRALRSFK